MSKKYTSTNPSRFINFSRASEATFVDSDGLIKTAKANEARIDHDPVTGEPLGLLIEESRTNLFPTSETSITPQKGTVETTFNPKFNINQHIYRADDTSGSLNRIFQGIGEPILANVPYTITVIFKNLSDTPDIGNKFEIILSATNIDLGGVKFNLTDGTFTSFNPPSNAGEILDVYMEDLGEGYYKLGYTGRAFDDGGSLQLFLRYFSETPDSRYSFSISKIQIEEGAFPTSYIPTNGSQVTRVTDSAKVDGAVFESFYNADEGTIFCEFKAIGENGGDNTIVASSKGQLVGFDGRIGRDIEGIRPPSTAFSNDPALREKYRDITNQVVKVAYSSQSTEVGFVDGVGFPFPLPDRIIGAVNFRFGLTNMHLMNFKYFPHALSDDELIALTTPETP